MTFAWFLSHMQLYFGCNQAHPLIFAPANALCLGSPGHFFAGHPDGEEHPGLAGQGLHQQDDYSGRTQVNPIASGSSLG